MRYIFSLFFIFYSVTVVAQIAIIKDVDGYTNVRSKASLESDIIFKIKDNKAFWYDHSVKDTTDWILVYIPKNDFSLGCSDYNLIEGFIHKSRLLPIRGLDEYTNSDFKFSYVLGSFNSTNRVIEKISNRSIKLIDGQSFWGTDGELPTVEIKSINVNLKGLDIEIHKAFYNNLFECDNDFTIYEQNETFFIYQDNSDGAGYYQVLWVINKNGLIQRLVGTIY
ncbi:hypothetical protein [Carboxylicivirga sp. N1Y90]|uniref:hypothetical protein n=1 Tax=Carboxylicivirga fragile TaxID=3417571 RepID=UPI003D3500C3|nr:hypothetical protein [Marinilabiliaceae bacterium N1Y90]